MMISFTRVLFCMSATAPARIFHKIFCVIVLFSTVAVFTVRGQTPVADPLLQAGQVKSTLILREAVEVGADNLTLNDLVDSSTETDFGRIQVGTAPALGKSLTIQRSDLETLLRRLQPKGCSVWAGAQQCVVSRPASEVTEIQLSGLIEDALRRFSSKEGEVRLLRVLNYSAILIPRQGAIVEVELISPNTGSQYGMAMINVEYQDRSFLRRNIRFEWEWKRPVWIAQRNLTSGRIQTGVFISQPHNVLALSGEAFPMESPPTNLILIRPLSKGGILLNSNVQTPIAVARGSAVTASIHAGSLLVSMKAIALENGSIGQTIRLQNPESRMELMGVVTHENSVEVMP